MSQTYKIIYSFIAIFIVVNSVVLSVPVKVLAAETENIFSSSSNLKASELYSYYNTLNNPLLTITNLSKSERVYVNNISINAFLDSFDKYTYQDSKKNTKIDYQKASKLKISKTELSVASKFINKYNNQLKNTAPVESQKPTISNEQELFIKEFAKAMNLDENLIRNVYNGTEKDNSKIQSVNAKRDEYDFIRFENEVKEKYDIKAKSANTFSLSLEDNQVIKTYNLLKNEKNKENLTEKITANNRNAINFNISQETFNSIAWPSNILVTGNVDSSAGAFGGGNLGHSEIIVNKDPKATSKSRTASAWRGRNSYINPDAHSLWGPWSNVTIGYVDGAWSNQSKKNAAANAETWLQNRPYPSLVNLMWGWDNKWDISSLYCSKLVWRAWIQANPSYNIDLDSNGGSIVYPKDIKNSWRFNALRSW